MKQTKKELQLREKLIKYNLTPNQLEPVVKCFLDSKQEQTALDQAQRFKDINEGKKIRDFIFCYLNNCSKKRGVYKITFGAEKFYIGRTKYIATRFKSYWRDITNFFTTGKYPPEHYLSKVFEHLKENQWGYFFEVELIDECYTVEELQLKEQKWLDKYINNPNCLNIGFIARKPSNEIDETPEEMKDRKANTGIARRGGRLVFFPKKKIEADVIDGRAQSVKKYTPQKKEEACSFNFEVPELLSDKGPTVYRLYYGNKYIVNKGKTLAGSLFLLQKGLGYFLAYDHAKDNKFSNDYYFKFYEYVRKNPNQKFKVEIILESDDAYEILTTEQLELNKSMKDKKCYNNNLQSYIPSFNSKTNMHGWVTVEQVGRFHDFLASI